MTLATFFASPLARFGALAAVAAPLVACVTDADRCLPGFVYAPQYDACLSLGGDDAGDDAASEAGAEPSDAGAGGATDGGLGASCNSDGDCTGAASFCLKDPTAASTAPGMC